jgi:hypothetical protein
MLKAHPDPEAEMGDPVYKTILLLDIQRFGPRLHLEQAEAHRVLYTILQETLARAAIEQTNTRTEDRGDGAFVLLDPSVAKVRVIRALLTYLPTALYDYNRLASESTQVRLRVVLHAGDVEITENGAVGPALVDAFRLLNSAALRAALEETGEPSVLCVSDTIHHDVIRHDHSGIRAEHFRPMVADSKEGERPAWVHKPGNAQPTEASAQPAATETRRPQDPQPSPTSANIFHGAVSNTGDIVAGDKSVTNWNRP